LCFSNEDQTAVDLKAKEKKRKKEEEKTSAGIKSKAPKHLKKRKIREVQVLSESDEEELTKEQLDERHTLKAEAQSMAAFDDPITHASEHGQVEEDDQEDDRKKKKSRTLKATAFDPCIRQRPLT
jgi:hypothetical protein